MGNFMTLADYSLLAFTLLNGARAIAYLPQIIRIHRDPHGAAAVSVSTWSLFAAANFATTWYALTVFSDNLTACVFAVNAAGCVGIAGLTALKRIRCGRTPALSAVSAHDSAGSGI
jgi:hypothetical protein